MKHFLVKMKKREKGVAGQVEAISCTKCNHQHVNVFLDSKAPDVSL